MNKALSTKAARPSLDAGLTNLQLKHKNVHGTDFNITRTGRGLEFKAVTIDYEQ